VGSADAWLQDTQQQADRCIHREPPQEELEIHASALES
jgi:hypothetical protein